MGHQIGRPTGSAYPGPTDNFIVHSSMDGRTCLVIACPNHRPGIARATQQQSVQVTAPVRSIDPSAHGDVDEVIASPPPKHQNATHELQQVTSTGEHCLQAQCRQNDTSIGIVCVDLKIRLTTLRKAPRSVRPGCDRPSQESAQMTPLGRTGYVPLPTEVEFTSARNEMRLEP
jgi:hypothetical protein